MSAPELPEDVSRWPDNPYTLLGVAADVLPADLRRAYTRLIRIYKPEQFPEHFRRIREAYETILRQAELAQFAARGAGVDSTDDVPGAGGVADWLNNLAQNLSVQDADAVEAEVHALWEMAVAGEEDSAYRRLREVHERHPGRQDICVRLYWLLALSPVLDSNKAPFDWLIDSVQRTGWCMPVAELVRREVEAEPALALGAGYQTLIDASGQSDVLLAVLQWRWQAASRLGRWEIIPADVEALRKQILEQGEEAWARLLLRGYNYLVWAKDEPVTEAAARYSSEIDGLQHLHGRLQQEFDQLESLRDLTAGWHALRRHAEAPQDVLALVRGCWLLPRDLVRPELWRFLEQIVRSPHESLEKLSLVQREAAVLLNYLGGVLQQLGEESGTLPDPQPPQVLAPRVAEFLLGKGRQTYSNFRGQALDFCLREAVAPGILAAFAGSPMGAQLGSSPLAEHIRTDWPLHFVSLAHRIFWM
jgi:hypothetical protein